ncbi:MAG: putative Acyl-CoA dehydrogenase, short-chain specific [Mycobacterium sp.]|nr:putative Acyl-CoA dehydrogenase, short-chain specific [Mycobacterium sp.]
MDPESEKLLRESVRKVMAGPSGEIPSRLNELGWDEVAAGDPAGAAVMLFEEQGRALVSSTLLDKVLLAELESELTAGVTAVCYPMPAPAGHSGMQAEINGVCLSCPSPDSLLLVTSGVSAALDAAAALVGTASPATLRVEPIPSFDADLSWYSVTGSANRTLEPSVRWTAAVAAGRRALAAEILGTATEIVRLAVEHTSVRHQFGSSIAAFQSVRHRLAEAQVHVTGARTLLAAAVDDGGGVCAALAKAAAGRAHERASAAAVQVCGAIGASLEHPLHRYVERGTVLDALLGDHRELARRLGADVLSSGQTPMLVEV